MYELVGSETQSCPPFRGCCGWICALVQGPRKEHSPKRVQLKMAFGVLLRRGSEDTLGCGRRSRPNGEGPKMASQKEGVQRLVAEEKLQSVALKSQSGGPGLGEEV